MNSFDFSKLLFRFRYQLLILLVGLILIGFGALFIKNGLKYCIH